jgi:hypothetical protein
VWTGRLSWRAPLFPPSPVEWRDMLVHPVVHLTFEGDSGEPTLQATFRIVDGAPRCESVRIEGADIRERHLMQLPLDKLMIGAFLEFVVLPDGGSSWSGEPTPSQAVEIGGMLSEARDQADQRARLQAVARISREHPRAPRQAVAELLGVSPRTAARLREQARSAGLPMEGEG